MNSLPSQINECRYLYLAELSEPRDNSLRVVVEEASLGEGVTADGPVTDARPIEHRAKDRVFELKWSSYIAFSVRDESYATHDDTERFEGRLFVLYSASHYLDFVRKATIASDEHPGPYRHWGLFCLNHIVDIVSTREPTIQTIRAA